MKKEKQVRRKPNRHDGRARSSGRVGGPPTPQFNTVVDTETAKKQAIPKLQKKQAIPNPKKLVESSALLYFRNKPVALVAFGSRQQNRTRRKGEGEDRGRGEKGKRKKEKKKTKIK